MRPGSQPIKSRPSQLWPEWWTSSCLTYERPGFFAFHDLQKITFLVHIENNDGQFVLHTVRKDSHIHDVEIFFVGLMKRDVLVTGCIAIFLGISGVNAIHPCPLQHNTALRFNSPKTSGRVGSEIGVSDPRAENNNPAFLKVAYGSSAYEGF